MIKICTIGENFRNLRFYINEIRLLLSNLFPSLLELLNRAGHGQRSIQSSEDNFHRGKSYETLTVDIS